jgi:hypothetical protein
MAQALVNRDKERTLSVKNAALNAVRPSVPLHCSQIDTFGNGEHEYTRHVIGEEFKSGATSK